MRILERTFSPYFTIAAKMAPNFNFFLVSLWLFLCAVRVSTLDQNIFSIDKEAASIWQSLSTAINTKSWSLAKEKHSELLNLLTLSSTPDAGKNIIRSVCN